MEFFTHPESRTFQLDETYKGAMFAWPVLLSPSLVTQRGWSLKQLNIQGMGEALSSNGFMCHDGQWLTFLSSAVDASFVSSARGQELNVMRMLVGLQQGLPIAGLASEVFNVSTFDYRGGGLVFILGTLYRNARDNRELSLPDPDAFLLSKERLEMEIALSSGVPHYRHQILPAYPISKAVAQGLRSGVQCWSGWFDEPKRCEFDLEGNGDVTFALSVEDTNVVYVRFGADAVSPKDMSGIQEAFIRSSAHSNTIPSRYKH